MNIEIKKIDIEIEKNILIGAIVDDIFLRDIIKVMKNIGYIKSPYIKKVLTWCFEYYQTYKKAPKINIEDIFLSKKELLDENIIESIQKILEFCSIIYLENDGSFNTEYYFDASIQYLKKRSIEVFIEKIKGYINDNEIIEAENEIAKYTIVEQEQGNGIDFLKNQQILIDIFSNEEQALLTIPGTLGKAIKGMYRGDIVAVGAGMKVGKTFFLMYLAFIALFNNLKLAYWTLEMKDRLMLERMWRYVLALPKKGIKTVAYTIFSEGKLKFFEKQLNKEFELVHILKKQKAMNRSINKGGFQLFDLSSGGGNVEKISNTLDNYELYHGYVPDVIIVDYADILDAERDSPKDYRHRINHTWIALKKLAQKRNCLIITASQLNKKSLTGNSSVQDAAEDIRKFSHVSHWINLNQNAKEKMCGIIRAKVSGRHDEFFDQDEVVITQCLKIGKPVIDSRYKYELFEYDEQVSRLVREFEKYNHTFQRKEV